MQRPRRPHTPRGEMPEWSQRPPDLSDGRYGITVEPSATKSTELPPAPLMLPIVVPSWPKGLRPQHLAVPSESTAHEYCVPALTATALVRPPTVTNVVRVVVLPSPSSPYWL